jgi:hypothetical protein
MGSDAKGDVKMSSEMALALVCISFTSALISTTITVCLARDAYQEAWQELMNKLRDWRASRKKP